MPAPETQLPFATRFWFAWICFFRVLFDGAFAGRAWEAREPRALPPAPEPPLPAPEPAADKAAALQLLALFQREGRFVDFLEQDITSFADAEIGGVARVVHDGCRKALHDHFRLGPVRSEEEGEQVTLEAGFDPARAKLTGNVQGKGPYKGVLRHRGWAVCNYQLPERVKGHDPEVIAPAEVEL